MSDDGVKCVPPQAPPRINLEELLCVCVSLAHMASVEIEEVVKKGEDLGIKNKDDQGGFDPQTLADRSAEKLITYGLRELFDPTLLIVGEEHGPTSNSMKRTSSFVGRNLVPQTYNATFFQNLLNTHRKKQEGQDGGPMEVDLSRVSVFIDPLDATRSFVAKRYQYVTTLIGICLDKKPVAGVVCSVFNHMIYFGGTLVRGVFKWEVSSPDHLLRLCPDKTNRFAVVTKGRMAGNVQHTLTRLQQLDIVEKEYHHASGSGYKFLELLNGTCGIYIFPRAGTSVWDTCAGAALVMGLGGMVTDANGHDMLYDQTVLENMHGFVVTLDPSVCKEITSKVTSTLDLTKLHGNKQIDIDYLGEQVLGIPVKAFESIDTSAVRQKHSTGVRLVTYPVEGGKEQQVRLFYKRIFPKSLPERNPGKWRRDIASYVAETSFYQRLAKQHPDIFPKVYKTEMCTTLTEQEELPDIIDKLDLDTITGKLVPNSFFGMFVEDLSHGYVQKPILGLEEVKSCFEALKTLHGVDVVENDAERGWGWQTGCYWSLDKRPEAEIYAVSLTWNNVFRNLQNAIPNMDQYKEIGPALSQKTLQGVATILKVAKHKCYVHGDLKTANVFFHEQSNSTKLIDFQWSGVGVGAADIIYLLLSSADLGVLKMICPNEEDFIEKESPLEKLVQDYLASSPRHPEYKQFLFMCRLCVVDYARVVISYQWGRNVSPEWMISGKDQLGRCLHNKNFEHASEFLRIVKMSLKQLKYI